MSKRLLKLVLLGVYAIAGLFAYRALSTQSIAAIEARCETYAERENLTFERYAPRERRSFSRSLTGGECEFHDEAGSPIILDATSVDFSGEMTILTLLNGLPLFVIIVGVPMALNAFLGFFRRRGRRPAPVPMGV